MVDKSSKSGEFGELGITFKDMASETYFLQLCLTS
jgi:hypothetical protein